MPAAVTSVEPGGPRGRRSRRSAGDERERAIVETAERLLEERPLHEISVDDLARGAGISRPTFYFYFPSKNAVLLTLLDRIVEQTRIARADAVERLAGDAASAWRQALTAAYDAFWSRRSIVLAGADAAATSPEIREAWSAVMESFVAETAAAIEAERTRGAAPAGIPARDLAIALNQMNERVLHASLAGDRPAIDEAGLIDVLLGVWLRAIYGSEP